MFQDIHDLDSFGHAIIVKEEDLGTYDVPFLTNDQVDKVFLASENQVCYYIYFIICISL